MEEKRSFIKVCLRSTTSVLTLSPGTEGAQERKGGTPSQRGRDVLSGRWGRAESSFWHLPLLSCLPLRAVLTPKWHIWGCHLLIPSWVTQGNDTLKF